MATSPASGAPALTFTFSAQSLRCIMRDGEPWFVAADVCEALGLDETHKMVMRLDDDEKGRNTIPTPGGDQEMTIINESGLYSLILTSRKPEAKKFKKWVTSEVLPAIRKTGRYVAPVAPAHPQGERLSANDWRNLKQAVWHAVHGFRFQGVWTQAVWFYLRRALGVPAPHGYTVDHLPRLAQELQYVASATSQMQDLLTEMEREAARRIFRKSELCDMVLAQIEAEARTNVQTKVTGMASLPSYLQRDLAAITQRLQNHAVRGGDAMGFAA